MAEGRTQRVATVGVAEHGHSAVLVVVATGGEFLDRRRIDVTDPGLPTHPHHHEGSWTVGRYLSIPGARAFSLADAVALVERVRASAARGARVSLDALAAAVPVPITGIAIRACPKLPPTTEERIADNRAQTYADSVMYRETLATAAEARGWSVYWYDRERVFRDAAAALGREDVDAVLHALGRALGPPWLNGRRSCRDGFEAMGGRPICMVYALAGRLTDRRSTDMQVYRIMSDVTGEAYTLLLEAALEEASTFSLVWRDQLQFGPSAARVRKALRGLQLRHVKRDRWPGTVLVGHTASVVTYRAAPEALPVLLEPGSLFAWRSPAYPEDLSFSTGPGAVCLATVSHEATAWILSPTLAAAVGRRVTFTPETLDERDEQYFNAV